MRKGIHPNYRRVLFVDSATGTKFINYSTIKTSEISSHEGEELPTVKLEISAFSHPFWTGQAREVDTEGRMDRFRRRYGMRKK